MSEAIAIFQAAREVRRLYDETAAFRIHQQIQAQRRHGGNWLDWTIDTLSGIEKLPEHKRNVVIVCYDPDPQHQQKRQPDNTIHLADKLLSQWFDSLDIELVIDGRLIINKI